MNYSQYITNEKLERDVLSGRPNLPKELEYSFNPTLATNNVQTYYYIISTTYGYNENSPINQWIVNNRLFYNQKDAESFKNKLIEYNLGFGDIYEDKNYLSEKIKGIDINFNTLKLNHQDLYAMWLDDKTTKLTVEELEKARREYKNKISEMLNIIVKNMKENRKKDEKIDYLTFHEMCYIITFCRFHPDIFFAYNAKNFYADYTIKDIQLFI